MHGYSSDNAFRGPRVYFVFGIVAIVAASALRHLVALPIFAARVDAGALSAGVIYGGLIFLYERWGWRWFSTLKNLNGTWVGNISTSYDGEAVVRCVVHVRQTWTRMGVDLGTAQSRSHTTMSALFEDQPGDIGLKYEYLSEPRSLAALTMHAHRGFCSLTIGSGTEGWSLHGDYFAGRGRETCGEIKVRRVSRRLLDFDVALKTEAP